ncbi:MAG: type 4a pilus biogenesis protein PilO [Candidatus Colwellbacteria bacterium]|nr:type 4a pilus biogenesis protein PilO [Candidatus Colwellbacteria bacterium]
MTDFQRKLLIRLGITAAIMAVVFGFIIYVMGDMTSVATSIKEIRSAFNIKSQAIGNLAGLQKDAEEARVGSSILQNTLPNRESLFVFTDEINRLARARNLVPVVNFTEEVQGTETAPGKIGFSANIAGDYEQLIDFMKALESSRYFTSIESFEMISQGSNTTGYQAVIVGEVFFKSSKI